MSILVIVTILLSITCLLSGADAQIKTTSITHYDVSLEYSTHQTNADKSLAKVNLNVRSTADSDTISGIGLWKVELYAAHVSDGSGEVSVIGDNLLNPEQSSLTFIAGETMPFQMPIHTDLDLFLDYTYFCVKLSKGANANPDFQFVFGETDYATFCLEISFGDLEKEVEKVVITSYEYDIQMSREDIYSAIGRILIDYTLRFDESSSILVGGDLWMLNLFGSENDDGNGAVRTLELVAQGSPTSSIVPGGEQAFRVDESYDFTGLGSGTNLPYICVSLGEHTDADVIFSYMDTNIITFCQEMSSFVVQIRTFEFTELDVEFNFTSLDEYSANFETIISITGNGYTSSINTTIHGTNLWRIEFFVSDSPEGDGAEQNLQTLHLSSHQLEMELSRFSTEIDMMITQSLNLTGVGARTPYQYPCIRMYRNIYSNPKFEVEPKTVCTDDFVEKSTGVSNITTPDFKTCRLWGDPHYNTFDGHGFTFQGDFSYYAVKPCNNEDGRLPEFQIIAENYRRKELIPITYIRQLRLDYNGVVYALTHPDTASVDGVEVTLPYLDINNGVTIHYVAPHKIITTDVGVTIRQDDKHNTDIQVPVHFENRICGLCGNFDGDETNECHYRNGSNMNLRNADCLTNFTEEWVYHGGKPEPRPPPHPPRTPRPCDEGSSYLDEARLLCDVLIDTTGPFADCHDHVSPNFYYQTCVYDLCQLLPESYFLCGSAETYRYECAKASEGIAVVGDWRTVTGCEPSCAEGMTFNHQGNPCPATCAEPEGSGRECLFTDLESCHCIDGMVLDGTRCVTLEECGCKMDNGRYLSIGGEFMNSDCTESCVCAEGQDLQCSVVTCAENSECLVKNGIKDCYCDAGYRGNAREGCLTAPKTCHIYGDPHFHTFDEYTYSFQGDCSYVAAKSCGDLPPGVDPFAIYIHNDALVPDERATYLTMIRLHYRGKIFKFRMNGHVVVDGVSVAGSLPYTDEETNVKIERVQDTVKISTDFGLIIKYDDENDATIKLPPSYFGRVCGLCGNADGNDSNERYTPDGTFVKKLDFANSWSIGECPSITEPLVTCEAGSDVEYEAINICSELKSPEGQFTSCHDFQDPDSFYLTCIYDLCQTLPSTGMFCNSVNQYLQACEDKGGKPNTDWRRTIKYCSHCPEGYKNFRGSCYKLFTYQRNNRLAQKHCENDNNGRLVTITSQSENNFITRLTKNTRAWIGGIRDDTALTRDVISSGDNSYQYPLIRLVTGVSSFRFDIDVDSDVYIMLSPVREPNENTPLYEIAIGQDGTSNYIHRCMTCEAEVEDSSKFLTTGVKTTFIVNFHDGLVQVTPRLGKSVMMEFSDPNPIKVRYVSFKTNGQPGTFNLYDYQFQWSTGEEWTYDNFHFGEANDNEYREDCLEINFNSAGLWNDHYCKMKKPFVCETDPVNI